MLRFFILPTFLALTACTNTPSALTPVKQIKQVAQGIAVPAVEHGQTALACLQPQGHNEQGNPMFRNRCSYEVRVTYCFETSGSVTHGAGTVATFEASCNRPNRSLFSGTAYYKAGEVFRLLSRGNQRVLYGVCPKAGFTTYHPRNAQQKYACQRKRR